MSSLLQIMLVPLFAALVPPAPMVMTGVPPATDEATLVALCEQFLDRYSSGRFDEVEAMFAPHAQVVLDLVGPDRQAVVAVPDFMARARETIDPATFREWISGEPEVLLDHKLGFVWAPYELEAGDQRATGFDAFLFINLDGEWKIASLAFTNRPAGDETP